MSIVLSSMEVDEFINKSLGIKNFNKWKWKTNKSFLFIDDCIEAFYEILIKKINNEVFNIGSDKEISIFNLAKKIKKICKSNSKIEFNSKKFTRIGGYEDISRRVPTIKKLKKHVSWKPHINLNSGLHKMMLHIKENKIS